MSEVSLIYLRKNIFIPQLKKLFETNLRIFAFNAEEKMQLTKITL